MTIELSFLGTLGTLSVIALFYILGKLSDRLGSVEKMSPLYRQYYIAIIFWGVAFVTQLLMARINLTPKSFPDWLMSPWFLLVTYYLPMSIGATISILVTWRYWSWLISTSK